MYVPALVGHVNDRIVKYIVALLDFCYLARRSAHDTSTLEAMEEALHRFHVHRSVFLDEDIREDFALPRQHSLVHYVRSIQLFGSPNGVCSSITESKHIRAVKKPWRRSSKYKPLGQIIRTNTRLNKLAAARAEFASRGMLRYDAVTSALCAVGRGDGLSDSDESSDEDVGVAIGEGMEDMDGCTRLAKRPGEWPLHLTIITILIVL